MNSRAGTRQSCFDVQTSLVMSGHPSTLPSGTTVSQTRLEAILRNRNNAEQRDTKAGAPTRGWGGFTPDGFGWLAPFLLMLPPRVLSRWTLRTYWFPKCNLQSFDRYQSSLQSPTSLLIFSPPSIPLTPRQCPGVLIICIACALIYPLLLGFAWMVRGWHV